MESRNQDGIRLAYASLAIFADDGTIDMNELESLLRLAVHDGEISDSEKAVLANVFNRVLEEEVDGDVWQRIQGIRRLHGV